MTMSLVQSLDESIPYEQHDMQITKSPKVSPARQGPHLELPYEGVVHGGIVEVDSLATCRVGLIPVLTEPIRSNAVARIGSCESRGDHPW